MVVSSEAYPMRGPRWAFEVTNHDNNPTLLRVDIQAPTPYRFSCVVILHLGCLPPQPCTTARKRRVVALIKAYIHALVEDRMGGQYAH
jgi:hypothetical protein